MRDYAIFKKWINGVLWYNFIVLKIITDFYKANDPTIGVSLTGFLVCAVIGICYLAITITVFFTIIATSVTNTFLTIALPLALICFMFPQTKDVFTQWLKLFISNLFLLLFMSAFLGFFYGHIAIIFDLEKLLNASFWQALLQTVLFTFVLIQVCNVIKDLAKNLAQVTLDSSLSSAGLMALAGKGTVKGAVVSGAGVAAVGKAGSAVGKRAMSWGAKGAKAGGAAGTTAGGAAGGAIGAIGGPAGAAVGAKIGGIVGKVAGTAVGGASGAAAGAGVESAKQSAKLSAQAGKSAAKAAISKIRNS